MKLRIYLLLSVCLLVAGTVLIQTTRPSAKRSVALRDSTSASISPHSLRLAPKGSPEESRARLLNSYGRLPLSFEANRGQTDPQVKFVSRGRGYTLFLTRGGETVLVFHKAAPKRDTLRPGPLVSAVVSPRWEPASPPPVVRMKLVGANPRPQVQGLDALPGKANYFIGNDPKKWRTNVPTYARVKVRAVYPGVDLVYYGNQRQLEHDFIVAPGTDPSSITIGLEGAEKLTLDPHGHLVVAVKEGELRFQRPVIYQDASGIRQEISGRYLLKGAHEVGFEVGSYDASKPVIIDPVLLYSTYLGGSGNDLGLGIAVDSSGNAYVAGTTSSTNFPTTAGAFQTGFGGVGDAFVTKLNPTGSGLVYSTYLGGSDLDFADGIAVDPGGNAYVTGQTNSTNFPVTPGAFQTTFGGSGSGCSVGPGDAFVTKLNPTGSGLVYSTYLGGSLNERAFSIAIDGSGNAYVTGFTISPNFPTTTGAFQRTFPSGFGCSCSGTFHVFVSKLNATGTSLVYSTFLGGGGQEVATSIAVDGVGNAYVTGSTNSPNFPTTPRSFQPAPVSAAAGCSPEDTFVTKLNAAGSGLIYSTYLGGSGRDSGQGIAVDALGNAYVAGSSSSSNFPTTLGAFQTTYGGGAFDAVVTKLNPLGTGLLYSTYLGGTGDDEGQGIALDSSFNAFVTGSTASTNFPTVNPVQGSLGGIDNAFVTVVNPLGNGLFYSTYLGGSGSDLGFGIALDTLPNPNAYVTGLTPSTNFPTTGRAFQTAFGGGTSDAFVAKIGTIGNQPPVARVGPDQVIECTSHTGTPVTLDGSKSSDPDGDLLTFRWTDKNGNVIGTTAVINRTLPLGTFTFNLRVTDPGGLSSTATTHVTVRDTTPPTLSVSLSPNMLWPPNHKFVQITANVQASDICDPNPKVTLVSITSNEPGIANDVRGAMIGTDSRTFFLRAERLGTGSGRMYTVKYRAMDSSGNMTFATATVSVPHDQRLKAKK